MILNGGSLNDMEGADAPDTEGLKSIATLCYALQAISFLLGITSIAALIIAYIKRPDARGTWLESHYRWQIRTFWFALLWSLVGVITWAILVGYLVLVANVFWVIYRIARGWLYLAESRPMYAQPQ